MPLYYLFVLAVCYSDFRLQWKHLWHTIPFFVVNLIFVPRFYLAGELEKIQFFKVHNQMPEMLIFHSIVEFQYVFYIVGVFLILKK